MSKFTAKTLFQAQRYVPDVQERLYKALQRELGLTFFGCSKFEFDKTLTLLDAESYDGTRDVAGPISVDPYSMVQFDGEKLIVTELVRANFKGGKFSELARLAATPDLTLKELQTKWIRFYTSAVAANLQDVLLDLGLKEEHEIVSQYKALDSVSWEAKKVGDAIREIIEFKQAASNMQAASLAQVMAMCQQIMQQQTSFQQSVSEKLVALEKRIQKLEEKAE